MERKNTIGEIIVRLRERNGYTQHQLCHKLCSVSTLAKIESGTNVPEHFLLIRLFERLGQSAAKLEYVLSREEYAIYELQYKIHEEICKGSSYKVKELVHNYRAMHMKHEKLKCQYIEQTEAQILWMKQAPIFDIRAKLDTAISQTMDVRISWDNYNYALSAEEVRLWLFRRELTLGTEVQPESIDELRAVLKYIDRHHTDVEEKVKVYPYAVILLGKVLMPHKTLKPYVEHALELLKEEGRLLYLTEIMKLYIEILKESGTNLEEVIKYQEQFSTVQHILNDAGLKLKWYRLFPIWDKEFSLDYETIRRQRTIKKITQLELSEEICEPETLSRIESGRRPSHKHYEMLADRLGRGTSKVQIGLGITANDLEMIELRRKLEKLLHRLAWDEAEQVLLELEKKLDGSIIGNQQYIKKNSIYINNVKGNITNSEARKEFEKLLVLSLGDVPLSEVPKHALSRLETNIMNHIAIMYMLDGKKEEAIAVYEALLEEYRNSTVKEIFHIREISTIMANLADLYEEVNSFDKAIELSQERIQISVLLGKGNDLGRALTTIAFTMERQKNKACKIYYKQALDMLELMEMKRRHRIVKQHFENI